MPNRTGSCVIPYLVLTSLLVLATGCGDGDRLARVQVEGTVTLDGNPLEAAIIIFRPDKGRAGRGKVENGKIVETYTYDTNDGIVPGNHKIAIQPVPDVMPDTSSRMVDTSGGGKKQNTIPDYAGNTRKKRKPAKVNIPSKYRNADRSGLTAEVTEDGQEITLELTSK